MEIMELGQKGNLFYLKYFAAMPSLENFEQKEDHMFAFSTWNI
jgi:hypothetical protein